MLASLIDLMVHVLVCLFFVKIVFFRKKTDAPKQDSMSWKSAADSMGVMETRLGQLQERDMKLQERVWSLEDQNRDLQSRLSRTTKDLLASRPHSAPSAVPEDDDDHDRINSVPTN